MAVNNDDAIKQIFSRCLLNCLQIPLWYVVLFNLIRPMVDVFVSVYALLDMLFKRLRSYVRTRYFLAPSQVQSMMYGVKTHGLDYLFLLCN